MYNESILFMSAFGQNVNWAYGDPAVNQKFQDLYGSNTVAIAPWTSATPLSGELMQASLDALLQNERNLLSAYPDAYVKALYGAKSNNVQKVIYAPIGDGQSVVSGTDEVKNAVTLSAEFGTLGGTASAAMLGATVPAEPFEQGKGWNYGVFGVKNGMPTWYPYNIEEFVATNAGTSVLENIYSVYVNDNTLPITNSAYILSTSFQSHSATLKLEELVDKPYILVSGDWKGGDLIKIDGIIRNLRVFSGLASNGSYKEIANSDVDALMGCYSGTNFDSKVPDSYYTVMINNTTNTRGGAEETDNWSHTFRVNNLISINSAFKGTIGIYPYISKQTTFWVRGTTYDRGQEGYTQYDDTTMLLNFKTSEHYKSVTDIYTKI